MQFQITALSVTVTTKPTAKGSYQQAEIAYKDLTKGQVASKKVMSFTNKDVYSAVANAKTGATYTVTAAKNEESGYWDWTNVAPVGVGESPAESSATQSISGIIKAASSQPYKSTYETPEERAKKQVLIMRQSSLAQAVATAVAGAKNPPKREDVTDLALYYLNWISEIGTVEAPTSMEQFEDVPL